MKFNRRRLILGLYVLALIVITELVTGHLKLPAWPAFVAWVLFFAEHMNPKRAPHILIGAAATCASPNARSMRRLAAVPPRDLRGARRPLYSGRRARRSAVHFTSVPLPPESEPASPTRPDPAR
jgi:hypothetical protein